MSLNQLKSFQSLISVQVGRHPIYNQDMTDDVRKKRAAALKYNPDADTAPRVTASGKGVIAQIIIDKAKEHGIPIRENPPLAELITAIPLGAEIQPELYEVVAEILAQIMSLDMKGKKS
jgi:flagellar biosynthesis protein